MKRMSTFILAFIMTFLFVEYDSFAYESVIDSYKDSGLVPFSLYNPERTSSKTIQYTPWIINYALQTNEEASAVNGGEGCQQISDIAISPVDNNLMLFGTDSSGIWRSEDGGNNWFSVNAGVNCWGVHDIIFHPTNRNIAYMIQGGPNASTGTNQIQGRTSLDGFYKSEDGGKSWKQILNVNIRASVASNRLIAFDNSLNVYLLSAEGLLKSTDSGETWIELYSFEDSSINYDLCISDETIVFTNSNQGVFVSLDGGATWNVRNIDSSEATPALGVDIDPENKTHFLACFGEPYYELYESFNSGLDWNILPVGANTASSSGKHPRKVMFGKRDLEGKRGIYMLFAQTYTPLRVSFNEGLTWSEASYAIPWGGTYSPNYGNAISLESSDGNTVYLGVGTILKSTDGGQTFTACNTPGFSGANVEEIRFSQEGKIYLSTTDRGLYKSNIAYDGTSYPTFQHTRDQNYSSVGDIGIDPNNENHVIYAECAANGYKLRESNDGGLNWTVISGTEASTAPKIIKFHNNGDIIYSTYFTSRNQGITWNANERNIYAVSDVNNDIVYSYDKKTLYKSSDCGLSFSEIYTADWNITYILPDNTNCNTVYIGLESGNIVKIENEQVMIMDTNNGLDNVAAYAMAQDPNNSRHIVIGGRCVDYSKGNKTYYLNFCKTPGLYETFDGGVSWRIVRGIPSMRVVFALAFSPNTHEIFVGGFTGGLLIYNYDEYNSYVLENSSQFSVIYNGSNKMVTVSGTINEEIEDKNFSTMLVMPASIMPSISSVSDIVYMSQIMTDENGYFEYTFKMPEQCGYGVYDVYIGGSGMFTADTGRFNTSKFDVVSFSFENTEEITATARVINPTSQSKSAAMIIAQYSEDMLIKIDYRNYNISHHTDNENSISISSPIQEQTTVYRAFIWDSMKNMRPLTGLIENVVGE